jgi:tRNA1(Val) A37 N6-methylase TrmN6
MVLLTWLFAFSVSPTICYIGSGTGAAPLVAALVIHLVILVMPGLTVARKRRNVAA